MDDTSLVVPPVRARQEIGRRDRALSLCLGLALCALMPASAAAVSLPSDFIDFPVITGLDQPSGMAILPDGRIFVVEQVTGRVRLIVNGRLGVVDPVLTVAGLNTYGLERGLLGIAVDPLWPLRPFIYLYYTSALTSSIHVSRYRLSGEVAGAGGDSITCDPASKYEILTDIPDLEFNHQGGTLRFGPDAMLYASLGEDGSYCSAQDTSTFRGQILRMKVIQLPLGPGGPPAKSALVPTGNPFSGPNENARLVWAIGLRNPFRFHIDPQTGDLFIADVGGSFFEEVDWDTAGGMNFGWPYREGPIEGRWGGCPPPPPTATYAEPIAYYDRAGFPIGAAIVSAGVYRSPCDYCDEAFPPDYEGDYFYVDYYEGFMRRIKLANGAWAPAAAPGQPDASNWATGLTSASDFAVGPEGALYYVRQYDDTWYPNTGSIHRILEITNLGVVPGGGHERAGVELGLAQPNPTAGAVGVSLRLARPATVEARVLDLQGRVMQVLLDSVMLPAGFRMLWWDGADLDGRAARSGLYFVDVRVEGERWVRRVSMTR